MNTTQERIEFNAICQEMDTLLKFLLDNADNTTEEERQEVVSIVKEQVADMCEIYANLD